MLSLSLSQDVCGITKKLEAENTRVFVLLRKKKQKDFSEFALEALY